MFFRKRTPLILMTRVIASDCSYTGFSESEEAAAAEQLLEAVNQGDEAQASTVLKNPIFTYLDNDVSSSASLFFMFASGTVIKCVRIHVKAKTVS